MPGSTTLPGIFFAAADFYGDFTQKRSLNLHRLARGANFDQADEALASQRGCAPEEVAQWRKENHYTWHECNDCKTIQKVPSEVHGNIPHSGGISVYKAAKLQYGGTL